MKSQLLTAPKLGHTSGPDSIKDLAAGAIAPSFETHSDSKLRTVPSLETTEERFKLQKCCDFQSPCSIELLIIASEVALVQRDNILGFQYRNLNVFSEQIEHAKFSINYRHRLNTPKRFSMHLGVVN